MKIPRIDSTMIGLFFLVAMAGSLIGASLIEPVITSPNPFAAAGGSRVQLLAGVFLELVNALCVLSIAIYMLPILKTNHTKFAFGYLSLRILEAATCSINVLSPLTVLLLADTPAGIEPASRLTILHAANMQRTAISTLLVPLFFCMGALLFYSALYHTRLLPRFIAIWGLLATVSIFAVNIINLFTKLDLNATMLLALPIILNEVFMGFWLISKGFEQPANQIQPMP